MKKLNAAFIGFIPRGLSFDEQLEVLKQYHALGYSAAENGNFLLQGDVEENKKRLEETGMKVLSVGLRSRKADPEVIKEAIDNAKKAGVKRVATYASLAADFRFGGRDCQPTYDEMMDEIENLNAIAKELDKEGLILTFHNHDAEFNTFFRRKCMYEYMVENSEYLKFQLDVGWVLYGHYDPVTVMKYVGDKLRSLHVKDWILGNTLGPARPGAEMEMQKHTFAMPNFVAPGTGLLPLKGVLEQGCGMNFDYAIVEMDFMHNMCEADELRCAYLNMRETGFVE